MKEKFQSFGMPVEEVDGHDLKGLEAIWDKKVKGPRAVIAHTEKGRGISFMKNKMEWHYLPMNETQYRQALADLDNP